MTGRKQRTVAYLRCSTDKQDLTHQREAAQRWAVSQGVEIEILEEPARSGTDASRPVLAELIKDCRKGKVKVLWAFDLDRIGRTLTHLLLLMDELHTLDVRVIIQSEGVDYATPAGRLYVQFAAMMAEYEQRRRRKRTVSGMARTVDPATGLRTRTRSGVPVGAGGAWIWSDRTGQAVLTELRAMRNEGRTWPEVTARQFKVFQWKKTPEGKAEQRAGVPSNRALRDALKLPAAARPE